MRPWATRTAKTALLAAGFAAAACGLSGVALAAGSNASSDASPGLSLGRLVAPAGVCDGANSTISGVGGHSHNGNTTGNFNIPIGSGNTVTAPVSVPVNVCGNAVAAGGFANANCRGGSTSCIGNDCNQPGCQGPPCHECHGPQCHECHGPAVPPVPG